MLFNRLVYHAQVKTIKLKKDRPFLFYQQGNKTDTISKNKGDVFYLSVPDSIKENLHIHLENGQLVRTQNDSLYKLNYVPAIRYECYFVKSKESDNKDVYLFKTLINGVSSESSNVIRITFKVNYKEQPLIENKFYYNNQ